MQKSSRVVLLESILATNNLLYCVIFNNYNYHSPFYVFRGIFIKFILNEIKINFEMM